MKSKDIISSSLMLRAGDKAKILNHYAGDGFNDNQIVTIQDVCDTDYIATDGDSSWWVCDYSFLSDKDIRRKGLVR